MNTVPHHTLPYGYVERNPQRGPWIAAFDTPPAFEKVQVLYDDGVVDVGIWTPAGWHDLSRDLLPLAWRSL